MNTRMLATAASSAALVVAPVALPAASALPADVVHTSASAPAVVHTAAKTKSHTIVVRDLGGFKTPSGNITCLVQKEGVRCEVTDKTWTTRKPKSCEYEYGYGMVVWGRHKAEPLCASDTIYGDSLLGKKAAGDATAWFVPKRDLAIRKDGDRHAALRYGWSLKAGTNTCTSARKGVTCTSKAGHGFFISRNSYRTW